MLKKFILAIGGFALVFASLGAIKAAQVNKMMSAPHVMPLTAVSTAEAREVSWSPTVQAIGSLSPVEGVMISADAEGTIIKRAVESGAKVKKGDLLIEIDSTVEQANLNAALATADLNKINMERAKDLFDRQAVSKAEYDTAQAVSKQSLANVGSIKALIAKKQVRAPFSGRVGIFQVNEGQFIGKGANMVSLQNMDQVYVDFSLPQRDLPNLKIGSEVEIKVDAYADKVFPAKITSVNSVVDPQTRNIAAQATLDNPNEELRVGMFVHVNVHVGPPENLIVVPATAISYASYGNSVYVVEKMKGEDGNEYLGVRQQFVKLDQARGDLIVVSSGLKVGEVVASTGAFKLRNKMPVQVNNDVQPSASVDPKPKNT